MSIHKWLFCAHTLKKAKLLCDGGVEGEHEFHTSANGVAFNAESVSLELLGYPDSEIARKENDSSKAGGVFLAMRYL